jgi:hypothetical protein
MGHPNQASLSYRVAVRLFDSAFAACERLSYEEQQLLLREIGTRLLQSIPKSEIPAEAPQPVKITGISVRVEERGQPTAGSAPTEPD